MIEGSTIRTGIETIHWSRGFYIRGSRTSFTLRAELRLPSDSPPTTGRHDEFAAARRDGNPNHIDVVPETSGNQSCILAPALRHSLAVRVLHAGRYLSVCRTVRPGLPSVSNLKPFGSLTSSPLHQRSQELLEVGSLGVQRENALLELTMFTGYQRA